MGRDRIDAPRLALRNTIILLQNFWNEKVILWLQIIDSRSIRLVSWGVSEVLNNMPHQHFAESVVLL